MGPALRTPDGRGPLHLAAVTATGWWMSTVIPAAWIALGFGDSPCVWRLGSAVYFFVLAGVGAGFGCFVRAVHRCHTVSRGSTSSRDTSVCTGNCAERAGLRPEGIIVCGAGLIDGRVSRVLAYRVDKGIDMWQAAVDSSLCDISGCEGRGEARAAVDDGDDAGRVALVLCGGQGSDESRSEAEAMAEYAAGQGVPWHSIVMEDTSTTTEENLRYAYLLMSQRLGRRPRSLIVVSTDFHCLRIDMVVKHLRREGFFCECEVGVVGAVNPPSVRHHTLLREYVALGAHYVKAVVRGGTQ